MFKIFKSNAALDPLEFHETDWATDEWSRGCPVGSFGTGILTGGFAEQTEFLRLPLANDKIYFAGTEFALKWSGMFPSRCLISSQPIITFQDLTIQFTQIRFKSQTYFGIKSLWAIWNGKCNNSSQNWLVAYSKIANEGLGYMEGAVRSGEAVAKTIISNNERKEQMIHPVNPKRFNKPFNVSKILMILFFICFGIYYYVLK